MSIPIMGAWDAGGQDASTVLGRKARDHTVRMIVQEMDEPARSDPHVPDAAEDVLEHPLLAHHAVSVELHP